MMRLYNLQSDILKAVNAFFGSAEFHNAVAEKFGITREYIYDGGIQKYLDGYEISPHPDIRLKAATWMININPSPLAHAINYHTHYMEFRDSRKYVEEFWRGNQSVERAWVPWKWAHTVREQKANNSIVIFSPADNTLHGVKARYDHLLTQRTQIYGNLWYRQSSSKANLTWESLDLLRNTEAIQAREDVGQGSRNVNY
ncbi:hypothetical protein N9A55_04725 [Luminiphilus sp.]|nr:hypothetical protein [Luminiphilus sp.]